MRALPWMLVLCMAILSFAVMSPSVQACGGGASDTIDQLLERTEIIVKARPTLVDSVRQNGILSVESYLVGGPGPSTLLFSQNDPRLVQKILDRTGTCDFFGKPLYAGEVGYFPLARRPDGAYVSTGYWGGYENFPTPDSTLSIYDADYTNYELTEEGFVAFIAEHSGEESTAPDASAPYPRYAPLRITTTEGKEYMLPIDSQIPVEVTDELIWQMTQFTMGVESPDWNQQIFRPTVCPGEDCVPISPNGIYWAPFVSRPSNLIQAYLFASTSDAAAQWINTDLIISGVGPRTSIHTPFERSIPLVSAPDTVGQAAWSPDGRQLAYSDAQGLWLVDVYALDLPPRLLLAAQGDTIPLARGFSPLGHYLSIENGQTWQNLDLVTGKYLPSGVFSPNERFLLAFDPAKSLFTLEVCTLDPALSCRPTRDSSYSSFLNEYIPADQFRAVMWRDAAGFIALACEDETIGSCFLDYCYPDSETSWWAAVTHERARNFAYEPRFDDMAVITEDHELIINDQTYDLALDGIIESVEWLPGLFYWR